jgi:tetratricopeptide (TPR) repeat protein
MNTLRKRAMSRAGRWLAVAVIAAFGAVLFIIHSRRANHEPWLELIGSANALDYRVVEGRLTGGFDNRPLRSISTSADPSRAGVMRAAARALEERWLATRAIEAARQAGVALLVTGSVDDAVTTLAEAIRRCAHESDLLAAIRECSDAALLSDFSAAALQHSSSRRDDRELLVALEAADRSWRLSPTPVAAWNRALVADRIGVPIFASRAWQSAVNLELRSSWTPEASTRRAAAAKRAATTPDKSPEGFFHRELIERAAARISRSESAATLDSPKNIIPEDNLAPDTEAALLQLRLHGTEVDRQRALRALTSYTRGRVAFENDRLAEARVAFASAEKDLSALRIPLALLARDQRVRSECSQSNPDCLRNVKAFHDDLAASGRYPWLESRAAYAVGQTLYRRGRIYEAAEWFRRAQSGFRRLNDTASEGVMHSLLANVLIAAGEPDLALAQYLEAIRTRSEQMGDRRRRQLEDAIMFMLRYGFLTTTEALLDELAAVPATGSARVVEATLRGILAARRGDPHGARRSFESAHSLLGGVAEAAVRAEVGMGLAIAEAGSRVVSEHKVLGQIDEAIAQHQQADQAIWLPQLLTDRGAIFERRGDRARAERDYGDAIQLLEKRAPRVDQMLIGFGVASDSESAFDRAIRLLLLERKIADSLSIAQRSAVLRISSLYAPSVGLRDVFQAAREPVAGDSVGEIQRALRPDQVAVAYHLLREELITWVVTRNEVFVACRGVRAPEVIRRIDVLRNCAARGGCSDGVVDTASNLLLRDWIERVPREATLLIQPPPELQAVPFAMLKTGGHEPLLTRNSVTTAPSLRAFVRADRADVEREFVRGEFFAAAARPGGDREPLPLALNEVTRAARFYTQSVVDRHATRAHFVEQSASYAIVHFAGHVIVNDKQPLLSAIVFDAANDDTSQLLYVHELGRHSFARARMVVLSGCDSGRSPRPTMSVANALLSLGVPSVVYTLWRVSDDAAYAFAVAFHRAIAEGVSRAEAVRSAQRSLQKHPEGARAWAAFALAGTPDSLNGEKR